MTGVGGLMGISNLTELCKIIIFCKQHGLTVTFIFLFLLSEIIILHLVSGSKLQFFGRLQNVPDSK